jgi:Cytochrome c556
MKKFAPKLALAAAALALAIPASAQFAKPEDAVKYRQSALYVMGQHFGRIGAMVNGRAPYDPKAALASAEVVAFVSHLPWAGFTPDSDMISPKAKPEIWKEPAKFQAAHERLTGDTAKLLAAAKTNDIANLKAAFGPAAQSCKSCHDAFRNK